MHLNLKVICSIVLSVITTVSLTPVHCHLSTGVHCQSTCKYLCVISRMIQMKIKHPTPMQLFWPPRSRWCCEDPQQMLEASARRRSVSQSVRRRGNKRSSSRPSLNQIPQTTACPLVTPYQRGSPPLHLRPLCPSIRTIRCRTSNTCRRLASTPRFLRPRNRRTLRRPCRRHCPLTSPPP